MTDLILHHYAMSPFSRKIRSMLGYTNLEWCSAITTEMPPRPIVTKLTGGYRKIPVAQIGADIFCDSRTIAREISVQSGIPELALEHCSTEIQDYVQRADLDLFLACVIAGGNRKILSKARQTMSWMDMGRFIWDRVQIGRNARIPALKPKDAAAQLQAHLEWLNTELAESPYLFGNKPNHADFSTYHSLWFMRDLAESTRIDPYTNIIAWMDRISAFGDGRRRELSAELALDNAKTSQPRAIPKDQVNDANIGKRVRIAPADYGRDSTSGILVGSSSHSWIISRTEDDLGPLHVHFPKQGFELTPA